MAQINGSCVLSDFLGSTEHDFGNGFWVVVVGRVVDLGVAALDPVDRGGG